MTRLPRVCCLSTENLFALVDAFSFFAAAVVAAFFRVTLGLGGALFSFTDFAVVIFAFLLAFVFVAEETNNRTGNV